APIQILRRAFDHHGFMTGIPTVEVRELGPERSVVECDLEPALLAAAAMMKCKGPPGDRPEAPAQPPAADDLAQVRVDAERPIEAHHLTERTNSQTSVHRHHARAREVVAESNATGRDLGETRALQCQRRPHRSIGIADTEIAE